ncbi:pum2 [Symbiodinium sp. CCMP2456]|nr:pum2 [Symbiodinium sp. CCMP2456]
MTLMAPSGDVVCFAPNIPNMIQYPMVYVQTGMTGGSIIFSQVVVCSSLIGPMVSWAPSCDGNAAANATVATSANTNMSGMVDTATAWWPHQAMQNGQNLQVQQMQTQGQQATLQPQPQPQVQQAMLQQVMAQAQEPGVKTASDHAKLFQTLRSHLEVGDNEVRLDAIHQIQGNVVALAMESESSSRAVQMALKVATRQTATELSAELTGHIAEVSLSLHGNHVLQRVIEVLPSSKTSFIAEELMTRAAEVARNVFGCRIFCRLLEQSANLTSTQKLLAKVMRDSEDLVQNQFGRYVAHARWSSLHRACPPSGFVAFLETSGSSGNASHVIEKALTYCSVDDRRALAVQLLQQDPRHQDTGVETLARTQYGGFVVKALLNLGGDVEAEARRQLLGLSGRFPELKGASKETRFAERLLKELGYLPEEEDADGSFGKDGQSARAGRIQRKPPRRTGLDR